MTQVPGASTSNPIGTVAGGGVAALHVEGIDANLSVMVSHCAVSIDVDGRTFFLPEAASRWISAALLGRSRTMRRL